MGAREGNDPWRVGIKGSCRRVRGFLFIVRFPTIVCPEFIAPGIGLEFYRPHFVLLPSVSPGECGPAFVVVLSYPTFSPILPP